MIAEPPSDAGAVHETVAVVSPGTALTAVGAPGTSTGVATIAFDAALGPFEFFARVVTEYVVPFVSPGIVKLPVACPVETQAPPSSAYSTSVIAEPPSAPSVLTTSSAPARGATVVRVGASGIGPAKTRMLK